MQILVCKRLNTYAFAQGSGVVIEVTHFDPWLSSFIDWTTTVSAVIHLDYILNTKVSFMFIVN